jgi:S1-C subfamily serine protease
MIRSDIVSKIRVSTCGVVRMEQRHEDLLTGKAPGERVPRPNAEVVGTGFLVRENLVLTNRHVIELISSDHANLGHHDNWYLEFTHPCRDSPGLASTFRRVINVLAFIDPTGHGGLDAGLIEFKRGDEANFQCCVPVEFAALDAIAVGADIAVCGFPFGNALLHGSGGLWRFGPVVHRGLISGVAPFEVTNPRNITAFLTDLNSAGGMSGSPVFTPEDGRVIGLHFAGAEGTIGCALPVDDTRVSSWIRFYERIFVHGEKPAFPKITGGGDIVDA